MPELNAESVNKTKRRSKIKDALSTLLYAQIREIAKGIGSIN